MNLPVVLKKGEARIDSRLLADPLGVEHSSVMRLLTNYKADFEEVGILRFQIGEITGRGQPQKYALLNEDQCWLLLTFSRNTKKVRRLKVQLIQAFGEARKAAELNHEYLPTYHAMHDQLARLGDGTGTDRFLHMNVNKLVNEAAHIKAGQRSTEPVPQKAMVIAAQHIASEAMQGATDGKQAYAKAKDALAPFLPHKRIGG